MKIRLVVWACIWFCFTVGATLGVSYPFDDDFESGSANWQLNGLWNTVSADAHTPAHALSDSPGRFYTNNTDSAATIISSVDLSSATNPALRFYHHYSLEPNYDFCTVEVSTNDATSWESTALAEYTGNLDGWSREQCDLTPYAGMPDVRVRFRINTDSSVVRDGWFVDDVRIAEAPLFAGITNLTAVSPHRVRIDWPAASTSVANYRVYRSRMTPINWKTAHCVATVSASTTSVEDPSASPKTKYYYAVMVLNVDEIHTLSAAVSVTTPAGMDYPFMDDGEGGEGTWNVENSWAIDAEMSVSPSHAWTDSPGTNYENGINAALTLVDSVDLTTAVNPALCFSHKYDFASGDSGNVELSLNGFDWISLQQITGNSGEAWVRTRIDLSAYTNATEVLVRFRLTTDASTQADGWHIDDIALADSPAAIASPIINEVSSHTMRLTWAASTHSQFARYEVYRSTSASVGINDTLVSSIDDVGVITCLVTNLAIDTEYFFRVYAVSTYGVISPEGAASSARTLNHPIPFTDDFEGSLVGWNFTGDWGVQSNNSYSGTFNLTDTPDNAPYSPNSNSEAYTAVDLTGSSWPVLRFHDRFDLGAGDYGLTEVSVNGTTWIRVYGMRAGSRTEWAEQSIDLSEWKNQSNLRIRFRLVSNSDVSTGDGWMIDKLSVAEHTPVAIPLPFHEGFENGMTNWLHTSWRIATNESYEGGASVVDGDTVTIPGSYYDTVLHRLALGGELALTNMSNPQITCWFKGHLRGADYVYFRTQISTDGGLHWTERSEGSFNKGYNAGWTRFQCDLSSYAGQTVRLRFYVSGRRHTPDVEIYMDKITIEERTADVLQYAPVSSLKSMQLSWGTSALGGDFERYELRRDTNPNVNLSDALLAQITDVNSNAFTDVDLSIGQTYYYRLFVVNKNDTYSAGSERSATTVPLTLPLTDNMENAANWDVNGGWGADNASFFEGSACLSDSPGDMYTASVNNWMMTAVDLTGSSWPVLRFHDRFDLGAGDYGLTEVSVNGTTWIRVYGMRAGSRTEWAEQSIDLSEWKNQSNLRIRFRLVSNSDVSTGDGWMIDKLSVAEHTPVAIPLPFHEGFENGMTNWLHTSWRIATNESYEGGASVVDGDTVTIPGSYYDTVLHRLALGGELALTNMSNPQITCWFKGHLRGADYVYFRTQISTDGGLHWTERSEGSFNKGYNAGWTRFQCDLSSYAGQTVRLRFYVSGRRHTPDVEIYMDKITIEERTADALLNPIVAHTKSMDLSWTANPVGSAFQRFELYRDTASGVGLNDTLVGIFTNAAVQSTSDSELVMGAKYYYRLFVVNNRDTYSLGSERSAMAVPLSYGFTNAMESLEEWTTTGSWGVDNSFAHQGTASISDSPGSQYAPSSGGYLLTSVDLTGSSWPVLRFWDRYDLAGGDWSVLEVSANGSSWTRLYGVQSGIRSEWREQSIDLSEWKNQSNLRIRFRLVSDSGVSTIADGWMIDDVSVVDHVPLDIAYPFYEGFEGGMGQWIHSSWIGVTNEAHSGDCSAHCTETQYTPGGYSSPDAVYHRLVLAGPLALTNTVNPNISFYVKGHLLGSSYNYFRVQVSTDEGLTWTERPEGSLNKGWNSDWSLIKCDLGTYSGQTVRVRFQVHGYRYTPDTQVYIDNIGIGGPAPGMPTLSSPANHESINALRPTLVVTNAIDYQGDSLDYSFEVYSDAMLTNLIASVPVVAEGDILTSWEIDTDLADGLQYWWRSRVNDGTNNGPWMDAGTFYVNHVNSAPHRVELQGPPAGAVLRDDSYSLFWKPTTDSDVGDTVVFYQIQIDSSGLFTNPVVNDASLVVEGGVTGSIWAVHMPLSAFANSSALVEGSSYLWRVRARDQWGAWSDWSTEELPFVYGVPPIRIVKIGPGGDMKLRIYWNSTGGKAVVEFTPSLIEPNWRTISEPTTYSHALVDVPAGSQYGYFRVRDVE